MECVGHYPPQGIRGQELTLDPKWCPGTPSSNVSLYYTPNNTETSKVVTNLKLDCERINVSPQNDAAELQKSLEDNGDVGLVFPDGLAPLKVGPGGVKNAVISYSIRMNMSEAPSTKKLLPPQKLGDPEFANIGPLSK